MGEEKSISFEDAVDMLPDGEYVHTFRNPGPSMMVGADHRRSELLDKMKRSDLELSGEFATAMKHGLVLFDETGPLFIATKEEDV